MPFGLVRSDVVQDKRTSAAGSFINPIVSIKAHGPAEMPALLERKVKTSVFFTGRLFPFSLCIHLPLAIYYKLLGLPIRQ